ncbi:MAG: aspartate--tRNA ligase [Candidatus Margulisbacteria bacterium]|nr:aspartate--tRNA ligase [Candidatus Margulisiibacteriota bacterium]
MLNWKERLYCADVSDVNLELPVVLYGWVDTIRDHGHLLFIHLRDRSGIVQLVIDPKVHAIAEKLRSEDVVEILGTVRKRSEDTINTQLKTGSLEVVVTGVKRLTEADTPPFLITEKDASEPFHVDEELRLKYRYLDLRRPSMQQNLIKRYRLIKIIRDFLDEHGFIEVETPVLTKSTPEGARDYLVPSRTHEGKFFALPQSPQLFKQLLMVSGLDRYFQIVKCFRDEDLRPNRQPEFTQVDLEASFIDEEFIYQLLEALMIRLYAHEGVTLSAPFPRISYADSMTRFGNDRPDIRFGMELMDVTEVVRTVQYQIFQTILSKKGLIKGITIKNAADKLSKNVMQEEIAKKIIPQMGAKGLTWMKVVDGKLESNIVQFFSDAEQAALIAAMGAGEGDILTFIADTNHALVSDVLGRFRLYIAERLGLLDSSVVAPCWVTDFPLYEKSENRLLSVHHPFTAPQEDISLIKDTDALLRVNAKAYDLVINGEEVGGGSIRIHDPKIQEKVFRDLGLSETDIQEKFGFFVNAFKFGTPPHGGLALGVDRLVSMILKKDSIREVIAFPKNRVAYCPLTQAPSDVAESQLKELKLEIKRLPKLD